MNLYTGIIAFIVCSYAVVLEPVLIYVVIIYGYLTQTITSPESTRIYYSGSSVIGALSLFINKRWKVNQREVNVDSKAIIICYLLVMTVFASEIYDPVINISGNSFMQRVFYICMALLLAIIFRSIYDIRYALSALSISSLYIGIYFLHLIYIKGSISFRMAFISGDQSVDPNYLALYLCLGLGPLLAYTIHGTKTNPLYRWITLAVAGIIFTAILFTTSRMGIIIALFILLTHIITLHGKNYNILLKILCFVLILGILLPELFKDIEIFREIQKRFAEETLYTGGGRTDVWALAFQVIYDNDIIQTFIGSGAQSNYTLLSGSNAHNAFIEYILDHGFIGFSLLISLLVVAWRNIKTFSDDLTSSALLCVWVTLVLASFSLSPFVLAWAWVAIAPMLMIPFPKKHIRESNCNITLLKHSA